MLKTPLAEEHEKLGARMVDFSGWYLPVQYTGIVNEHTAVRQACGAFDTCHMGRIMVTGSGSGDYLSAVVTVDAANMPVGRCRYGFLLNNDAGIIDDLIVYRLAHSEFMVVVNSATHDNDLVQLRQHIKPGVKIEDVSSSMAKIDIQGPLSPEITSKTLAFDLTDLRYFQTRIVSFRNSSIIVSRTGYTGETGFELYVPTGLIAEIWTTCLKHGATPSGLGARDTLRLEAGLPLYGHEFSTDVTPLEAGFMRYIDLQRSFIGSETLRMKAKSGPARKLTPFTIEGRQSARNGNAAIIGGEKAGFVTSGSFAPSLGYCIGFAYLDSDMSANSNTFEIDNGRKILNASVSKTPFYKK